MGRDNQPKERQRRDLERKQQRGRARCERILIVSEGSKTEPLYFNEIRMDLRLPVRNITIFGGESGTDPLQIVQYAKDLFERGDLHKGIEPRSFERIFAVFDRDQHHGYLEALNQANILDGKLKNDEKQHVPFKAITSVPCFELWLLLHYQDVQAPLCRDEVLQRLRQNFPCYAKGACDAYATTRDRLNTAMQRAEMLAAKFTAYSYPEPFTAVGTLVKLMTALPQ
ncbi:MAG: RloB family protein [Betaproteobacteria bacterium]|nr:RloB family protein [Betaproteobacteria bacterium]